MCPPTELFLDYRFVYVWISFVHNVSERVMTSMLPRRPPDARSR